MVTASWKRLLWLTWTRCTQHHSLSVKHISISENVWSNTQSLYFTATWEKQLPFKCYCRSFQTQSESTCLSGTSWNSSSGYDRSLIQPWPVAIRPECDWTNVNTVAEKNCPSISTVTLSSFTTWPQTSTFGGFVWNTELQIAEKKPIGRCSKLNRRRISRSSRAIQTQLSSSNSVTREKAIKCGVLTGPSWASKVKPMPLEKWYLQ